MNRLPDIGQVSDLRLGDHPGFDAWFYSFCAENNIEHGINPSGVASPEQLRFMVAMDERQVYAPCSRRHLPGVGGLLPPPQFSAPRAQPVYRGMALHHPGRPLRKGPPEAPRHDQLLPPPFPGLPRARQYPALPPRQAAGHHAHQPFRRGRSVAERAPVLQRNARLLPPFADPAEGPRTPAPTA